MITNNFYIGLGNLHCIVHPCGRLDYPISIYLKREDEVSIERYRELWLEEETPTRIFVVFDELGDTRRREYRLVVDVETATMKKVLLKDIDSKFGYFQRKLMELFSEFKALKFSVVSAHLNIPSKCSILACNVR